MKLCYHQHMSWSLVLPGEHAFKGLSCNVQQTCDSLASRISEDDRRLIFRGVWLSCRLCYTLVLLYCRVMLHCTAILQGYATL